MNAESRPLVLLYGYPRGPSVFTFVGRTAHIDIEDHNPTLRWLLPRCTGRASLSDLLAEFPGDPHILSSLVEVLEQQGILSEPVRLYEQFHEDSRNPSPFPPPPRGFEVISLKPARTEILDRQTSQGLSLANSTDEALSSLETLIAGRATTRRFSDQEVPATVLNRVIRSMYGIDGIHSAPSAGGLFPFNVDLLVRQDQLDLDKGIYRWARHDSAMVRRADEPPYELLVNTLDNEDIVSGRSVLVVLSAPLQGHARKYANRGYRYTLIEAGHIAQNAQLLCAAVGLGIFEYGGFLDKPLTDLFQLVVGEAVFLVLGMGWPDHDSSPIQAKEFEVLEALDERLMRGANPILFPASREFPGLSFAHVSVAYRSQSESIHAEGLASGTGLTRTSATVAAIAEAYERWASGQLRVDVEASATELGAACLTPTRLTPYQASQPITDYGLALFDPSLSIGWREGIRQSNGDRVFLAVDNVYYPLETDALRRKPYFHAHSNGVAAHTTARVAALNALLELIERDAIMVTWYTHRSPGRVTLDSVGSYVASRARFWASRGRAVTVLDLTLDSVPVALVAIRSEAYPCFVSGAAAAFSFKQAAIKAFREAELMLVSHLELPKQERLGAENVHAPQHHGAYYMFPETSATLRWLFDGETTEPPADWMKGIEPLRSFFDPIEVDLSDPKAGSLLRVIRVVSEHLLPINFGFGLEHLHHKRVENLGLEWFWEYPAPPHFFA